MLQSWHWQRPEQFDPIYHRYPFRWLSHDSVGLDLGSSWLKYAVARHGAGQPRLVSAGGIPIEARTAGQLGKIRARVAALLTVRERVPRGNQRWIVGVSGQGTMVRIVDVPRLPRRELRKAVLWQAQKKIPFPLEDAHVAITYLKSAPNQPVRALVTAAIKRLVDDLLYLLAEVEIKPAAITLPGFGLECLQRLQGAQEAGTCHGVLDIGAQRTTFAVFANNKLDFYREIDMGVGGDASSVQGEATHDVPAKRSSPLLAAGPGLAGHGERAIDRSSRHAGESLEQLFSEIQNTLEYYAAQAGGARIHRFLVLGGGAGTPGLTQQLGALLETPVELSNPLAHDPQAGRLAETDLPHAAHWAGAFGYSLVPRRAANLLPLDFVREQDAEFHSLLWRTATGTALAVSVILTGSEYYRGQAAQDRADLLAARNTETASQLSALGGPETEASMAGHRRWYTAMERNDIRSAAILRWLSALTPAEVVLDRLQVRPVDSGWAEIDLAGEVRTSHDQNEVTLAAYVDRLSRSGYFHQVNLLQHSSARKAEYEQLMFQLTLRAPLEERSP